MIFESGSCAFAKREDRRTISKARNSGPLDVEPIAALVKNACVDLEVVDGKVGVAPVSCARCLYPTSPTPNVHRSPTRRDVSVYPPKHRWRNDTDPTRRQIRPRKQLVFLSPRDHLSVNCPRPATGIRQLWEVPASWNLITRPAMLTSVPPRGVIVFFLNLDSLILCVHLPTLCLLFESP